jgi:ABC-type multidrug transport system ATPase subunit
VSFSATAGQVHGLVGANGAGKTTLIKHLLGLLRAETGSVRVFGLDRCATGQRAEPHRRRWDSRRPTSSGASFRSGC